MFNGQQNVMKNRWCYSGSAEEPYALCGAETYVALAHFFLYFCSLEQFLRHIIFIR
jgi:hypothetical protein